MSKAEANANRLLIAIIQAADSEALEKELSDARVCFSRLPSVGGFLREHNVTFFISCSDKNYENIKKILISTCKKRVSYVATPIENPTMTMPFVAETIIGGVNIFSMDLDHFEEI
jgi:uncharacterized protein YaaQ